MVYEAEEEREAAKAKADAEWAAAEEGGGWSDGEDDETSETIAIRDTSDDVSQGRGVATHDSPDDVRPIAVWMRAAACILHAAEEVKRLTGRLRRHGEEEELCFLLVPNPFTDVMASCRVWGCTDSSY